MKNDIGWTVASIAISSALAFTSAYLLEKRLGI